MRHQGLFLTNFLQISFKSPWKVQLREVARLQVGATREKRRSASPCAPCRQDVGVVRGDNGRLSGAVAAECGGTVEIGGSSIAGLSSLARG